MAVVRLLTVAEVAEALAVSRPTAYRLIQSQALGSVVVSGRSVRVEPRQLEEFKARRTRKGMG